MSISSQLQSFYGLLVREQILKAQRQQVQQVIQWMPLPLSSVHVAAQTFDFCSEVNITQTYTNQTPYTLESEYIFPLDENSAVCAFSAEINGRIIHGLVKEKAEAKKEFERAKAQGKSTMLLEQKQENVFKISIGNLEANSECKIKLTYITTLDLEGKANRMVIPAVVAPKYEPHHYWGWNRSGNDGFNGTPSVQVTTGPVVGNQLSFFQSMTAQYLGQPQPQPVVIMPPTSATTVAVKQQTREPQRFSMQIEVLMPSEILAITSETHQSQIHVTLDPVVAQPSNGSDRLPIPHHATIRFGMNADGSAPSVWPESLGSKDFILTIAQKQYLETRAVLEVDPVTGSQAVQLAFCPQTLDLMDASSLQTEIIFLIDQSGSMAGAGIEGVKSCLNIFLRSLPVACKFNLVSFGSTFRSLFPKGAQHYSEDSIQKALNYAANISADLGGTEIFAPLKSCFEATRDVNYPRQIFLLTDGQVTNTQQLIDLTRSQCIHSRLFTFGLGSSVDRHLVKSLAAAGRGECEFVTGGSTPEAKQELNAKVMRNLIKAMQPSLTDVKVDWSGIVDKSNSSSSGFFGFFSGNSNPVLQCPNVITPIFPPNREIIYALGGKVTLPPIGGLGDQIVSITVSAQSNRPNGSGIQGRVQWTIPLNLSRPQSGTFIHKLAARARISEIQNYSDTYNKIHLDKKVEVLKLALKYQLLSNYTSFIIVDDRKVKGARKKKVVPPPVLANAQVDMFNAFMSSQIQPGLPVNSNGYAFTPAPSAPVQPVQSLDEDDSDDECEFSYDLPSVTFQQQVQPPLQQCFMGAPPSSGASFSFGASNGGSQSNTRGRALGGGGGGAFGGAPGMAPCAPSTSSSSSFSFGAPCAPSVAMPMQAPSANCDMLGSTLSKKCKSKSAEKDECAKPARRNSSTNSFADAPCVAENSLDLNTNLDLLSLNAPPQAAPSASFGFFAAAPQPAKPSMAQHDLFGAQADKASSAFSGGSGASANQFTVLVQMNCIDGTWNLTEELLTLVKQITQSTNQSPATIKAVNDLTVSSLNSLALLLPLSPKAVATLLVLWTFQTCFPSRSSEWMMLVGKAKACLRGAHQVQPDQIEQLTKQIIVA